MKKGNFFFTPETFSFRVVVTFILLSIFMAGGFGAVIYFLTWDGIKQVALEDLGNSNRLKKSVIEEWILSKEKETALMAAFIPGASDSGTNYFKAVVEQNRELEGLYFYDSASGRISGYPNAADVRITDRSAHINFSFVYAASVLSTSIPVNDGSGKITGIFKADYNFSDIPSFQGEGTSFLFLADQEIVIPGEYREKLERDYISQLIGNPNRGFIVHRNNQGEKIISTAVPLSEYDAYLITDSLYRDIFSVSRKVLFWVMIGIAFSMVVFFFTGVVIASSVILPITEMSKYADSISAGDFEKRLPVRGPAELKLLSTAFNKILDRTQVLYKRIARSERHFRSLIETGTDAVAVIRWSGIIEYVSPPIENILGFPAEELIGKSLFNFTKPDTKLQIQEDILALERNLHLDNKIISLRSRDGEWRLLEVTGSLFKLEDGENRIAVTLKDISKKIKAESEMQRVNRLTALAEMAGNISNEFNNILTGVIGNLSLIKMSLGKDNTNYQQIEGAIHGINRAKKLTHELLAFSNGKVIKKEYVSLENILETAVKLCGETDGFSFFRHYDDDLWPVHADGEELITVFHNILIKGMKRMNSGGTISIEAVNVFLKSSDVPVLEPGPYVRVKITDHGEVISEEKLHVIFDPFKSEAAEEGMGLSLSYVGIKKHNGHITVESDTKQGTVYTVYLPGLIFKEGELP
jgi:PAS domain S-box-containing protein